MAQSSKQQNKRQNKLTRQQRAERVKAAQERERRAEEAKKARERTKQVFTVVICVILVLALGIPTMALAFLQA